MELATILVCIVDPDFLRHARARAQLAARCRFFEPSGAQSSLSPLDPLAAAQAKRLNIKEPQARQTPSSAGLQWCGATWLMALSSLAPAARPLSVFPLRPHLARFGKLPSTFDMFSVHPGPVTPLPLEQQARISGRRFDLASRSS